MRSLLYPQPLWMMFIVLGSATYTQKRGASSVPSPRFESSRIALLVKPSNAESPTTMYVKRHKIIMYAHTTPSRDVPVALFLTDSLGGCEVLKASKPKRSENAFSMYVSHLHAITPRGYQHSERRCKYSDLF